MATERLITEDLIAGVPPIVDELIQHCISLERVSITDRSRCCPILIQMGALARAFAPKLAEPGAIMTPLVTGEGIGVRSHLAGHATSKVAVLARKSTSR
jgi:hypothetical protein